MHNQEIKELNSLIKKLFASILSLYNEKMQSGVLLLLYLD